MKDLSYLSELEKESIIKFNENPIMKEAVRKVVLSVLYKQGTLSKKEDSEPTKNFALMLAAQGKSDEEVGASVKIIWAGINLLEGAFQELLKIKEPTKKAETKVNPAR